MIFEPYAHYDDDRFTSDRDELLTSLPAQGIERIINVGASIYMKEKESEHSKHRKENTAGTRRAKLQKVQMKKAKLQSLMQMRQSAGIWIFPYNLAGKFCR